MLPNRQEIVPMSTVEKENRQAKSRKKRQRKQHALENNVVKTKSPDAKKPKAMLRADPVIHKPLVLRDTAPRARWDYTLDSILVDTLWDHVIYGETSGRDAGIGFTSTGWTLIVTEFNRKTGLSYGHQIVERFSYLRNLYMEFKIMLSHDGFSWDLTTSCISGHGDAWKAYVKCHPEARKHKNTSFPLYTAMALIFCILGLRVQIHNFQSTYLPQQLPVSTMANVPNLQPFHYLPQQLPVPTVANTPSLQYSFASYASLADKGNQSSAIMSGTRSIPVGPSGKPLQHSVSLNNGNHGIHISTACGSRSGKDGNSYACRKTSKPVCLDLSKDCSPDPHVSDSLISNDDDTSANDNGENALLPHPEVISGPSAPRSQPVPIGQSTKPPQLSVPTNFDTTEGHVSSSYLLHSEIEKGENYISLDQSANSSRESGILNDDNQQVRSCRCSPDRGSDSNVLASRANSIHIDQSTDFSQKTVAMNIHCPAVLASVLSDLHPAVGNSKKHPSIDQPTNLSQMHDLMNDNNLSVSELSDSRKYRTNCTHLNQPVNLLQQPVVMSVDTQNLHVPVLCGQDPARGSSEDYIPIDQSTNHCHRDPTLESSEDYIPIDQSTNHFHRDPTLENSEDYIPLDQSTNHSQKLDIMNEGNLCLPHSVSGPDEDEDEDEDESAFGARLHSIYIDRSIIPNLCVSTCSDTCLEMCDDSIGLGKRCKPIHFGQSTTLPLHAVVSVSSGPHLDKGGASSGEKSFDSDQSTKSISEPIAMSGDTPDPNVSGYPEARPSVGTMPIHLNKRHSEDPCISTSLCEFMNSHRDRISEERMEHHRCKKQRLAEGDERVARKHDYSITACVKELMRIESRPPLVLRASSEFSNKAIREMFMAFDDGCRKLWVQQFI